MFLTSLIQKAFFRDVKVEPKGAWVQRAISQGNHTRFTVLRNNKKIVCFSLSPGEEAISNEAPIVLLSHPISRKAKYFFTETERAGVYLKQGFEVFAFDYNGFGESDVIDLYYWRDVTVVLEYLKERFPQREIVLHGTSFGAFHIIRALESLPLNSSVVLENVNKSLISYWRRWPVASLLVRLLLLLRVRAVVEMDVRSVVRALNRPDLRIQFIACENDDLTTLAEMQELYGDVASENKTFTVFRGVGHLAAPKKDLNAYQSALFSRGV